MGNMYYGDGTNKRLLSGIAQVPRLTLAQYQALTVKPRFWVRTDAPETYNQLITWDDQAELGSKNIIKYPYAYGGGSTHGLTVTVNTDGSVTASGQPNQAIGWVMITNIITEYDLQVGDKLIFSEHEVNNNNASAALTYVNPASPLSLVQGDYELTVTSEMVTNGVSFILWFNNGVNLSTPVTFKPMVRLTSCSDSTWASPALTNRKLTELTTYLSETKIKQLEAGIASASTATGTEYSSGVSVKDKIDNMDNSLGNKMGLLFCSYWAWNTVTSFAIETTSAVAANSIIVYGARNGRGFLFICPNDNNEVLTIFNNTGCGITNGYDSSTKKHTITLTSPTSITGSSVLVCAFGW